MRMLQGIVAVESVVLVVLLALFWRQAPPLSLPPVADAPGAMSEGAVVTGALEAAAAAPGRVAGGRERAEPVAGERAPAVVLQGRLLGLDPPPKDDAVRLWCRRDDAFRSANVLNGSYAVAGLAPGAWRLHCEVEGCVMQEFEHALGAAPIQRLDLTLVPAVVLPVFVRTPAGTRLQVELNKLGMWQGMQVIATASPLPGDLAPTENSSVGDLGLGRHRRDPDMNQRSDPEGNDGRLELDRPPPLFAALLLRHMVLAQQRIEPGQKELRFVVDVADVQAKLATVRLRVVGNGQPVAKARIELSTAQGGGSHAVTGDDGTAEVKNVQPGLAYFEVTAKDCESYTSHVIAPAGAVTDLDDVVLTAPHKLLGRVVDGSGKGISASLQWTALDLWRPPHPMQDRRNASADGDGNFELWGTGDRRYVVHARTPDNRTGYAIVDARSAAVSRVEIAVQAATNILFDHGGDGLATCVVVVRNTAGDLLDCRRIEPRWRQQTVALPPGEYGLEVFDGAGTFLRRAPLVVGTQKQRVEVP